MKPNRTPFLLRTLPKPFAGLLLLVSITASAQSTGIGSPTGLPAGASVPTTAAATAGRPASGWSAAVLVRETATDNVALAPSGSAEFAMVTEITPTVTVNHSGARTKLYGNVSMPVVIYAPSGVAGDRVYPAVDLLGNAALVQNLLFVDASVKIAQQFFNPFGAQPAGFVNPSQNRYRSDSYRISPYIKGAAQNISYELRNENIWTRLSGAPGSTNDSYYSSWSGLTSDVQGTLGWQSSFKYTDVKFTNQNSSTTQIYRLMPLYNVNPQVRLTAIAGYEENQFTSSSSSGSIYGVGFIWRPTLRTNVAGNFEQRFFGSSYRFSFNHTTPLSVWQLAASRDITSYPQQVATIPGGVSVAGFLDNLFVLRIPDAAERQQLIDSYILDRGLPSTLSSAVNLYSEQIQLQQSVRATVGLIGARNTVLLTLYNVKNEPITASGSSLPPLFVTGSNNTQTGATAVWTYQVTPSLSFVAAVDGTESRANAPATGNTRQGSVRVALSRPLSPSTKLVAGARYQSLQSDVASDYTESSVFIGLSHRFR